MVQIDAGFPEIYYDESRSFDSPPTTLIFMTTCVMVTVLICSSVRTYFNLSIPRKLPVLIIAIIFGIVVEHIPHLSGLRLPHLGYPPRRLFAYYMPAYCLRTIHMYKKPTFRRYILVYFIMSFVPLLSSVMHGLAILAAYEFKLMLREGLLFGIVFSSIQPFFIMSVIANQEKYNLAHSLLQGEALLAANWCILSNKLVFFMFYDTPDFVDVLIYLLRNQVGALAVGYVFAKMTTIPLAYIKLDASTSAGIMVGTMVLCYCTADLLGVQSYLACLVVALIANYDKHTFNPDNEKNIAGLLEVLYTMADLATYSYCILKITVVAVQDLEVSQVHLYFFNYFAIIISRFLSYFLMYPVIKRILPSFTFGNVMILTTGNVVGNIPLILNVIYLHLQVSHDLARMLASFMLTNALLTTIMNNAGMSALMTFLHSTSISAARIASVGNCLEKLVKEREKIINTIKTKRYMADVNWQFVRKASTYKLPPPYPELKDDEPAVSEEPAVMVCCENCPLMPEIYGGSRPRKMAQYKRNAMKKIIQEIKLIAKGHCEKRLINEDCLLELEKMFDNSNHNHGLTMDSDKLRKYFKHNRAIGILTNCYHSIFERKMARIIVPRAKWRRVFYYILCNIYFRIFISLVIIATIVQTVIELMDVWNSNGIQFMMLDTAILIISAAEFVITIIAYSWIYWSDGFQTYFSSHWHIIDFISLVITLLAVIKDVIFLSNEHKIGMLEKILIQILTILHAFRGLRIFKIVFGLFPSIINKLQKNENEKLTFVYELTKEIIDCTHEIMLVVDRFVENKEVRQSITASLEQLRIDMYKLLAEKSKLSWIATTVQTKQVINASQYVMKDALQYLKISGYVDEAEFHEMHKSITKNVMKVKSMMKISALTMHMKFSNVWWLDNDANIIKYLRKRAIIENIPPGEIICNQGHQIKGVYIVILGVVRLMYEPSNYIIDRLTQDGFLPIVDHINTAIFEEPMQIFISPGNTFGELGFLTGRYSDCDIMSCTDVKMCFIPNEDLEQCVKDNQDTLEDLEARLWKYTTTNLAAAILIATVTHESYTLYDIKLKVARSFVPNLSEYTYFVITEQIEDTILLEGLVVDYFARDVFIAPCYIPRSVLKLEIPKHSFINKQERLQTKLMIIPTIDTDKELLMELEEELANIPPSLRKFKRSNKRRKKLDNRFSSKISVTSGVA